MSDKIDGNNPVNFNNLYKREKNPTAKEAVEKAVPEERPDSDLGMGIYGRAQVNFNGISKNVIKDVEYYKENPELVEFCGDMVDHYAAQMPYTEAVEKAHSCADVFKKSL